MYFNTINEFIEMGGHGFYIWLSYAIVLGLMGFYYIFSKRLTKKQEQALTKFYRRMNSRNETSVSEQPPLGEEK